MARIPEFFGIDFGDRSVKLAQAERKGDKAIIKHIGIAETTPDLLKNTTPQGLQEIASQLKEAGKQSGIRTKNCVIAIPESEIFSKVITLPEMKAEDVEEAIHWAAKPVVPMPLDQVNLAYLEVGKKQESGRAVTDWYVVAASKDLIDKYQRIIKQTHLQLLAVETESLAVSRMVYRNTQEEKPLLIIDIGSDSSNIIISNKGAVTFSQSVSTGSHAMTKVIASDYGLDMIQAEKYKTAFGIDFEQGEGKIANSIQPIVDSLINELSRTISFYKDKMGGDSFDTLFATGGGSLLPGLGSYMQQKLQLSLSFGHEPRHITFDKKIQKNMKKEETALYAVPVGLAMKGLFA